MIDLHPDARKRLVEVLAGAIESLQVRRGEFVDARLAISALAKAENVLPANLRDQLLAYIGDFPIFAFVTGQLDREIKALDWDIPDVESVKLTDIDGLSDPRNIAEKLVAQVTSLPWKYNLTIQLPDGVSELLPTKIAEKMLNDQIRFIRPAGDFAKEFPLGESQMDETGQVEERRKPLNRVASLWAGLSYISPAWHSSSVYLQIKNSGFVGPYGGSALEFNAERTLRAVAGLGIALRLFYVKKHAVPQPSHSYFVHKQSADQSWQFVEALTLTDQMHRSLKSLTLCSLNNDTPDRKRQRVASALRDMRAVFSQGSKADPIVLASQWLFDSSTGEDASLNFVQAMVVLEILLGDKAVSDEIGLGALLRNRCAYLIGMSYQERELVLRSFNDIYRVRSEIVHRGKHRLDAEERQMFWMLQRLCHRVIQKEVQLLRADEPSEWAFVGTRNQPT